MTEQETRKRLAKLLAEGSNNYTEILELSASFDKNHASYSVDDCAIDCLGRELIEI